MTLHVEHRNDFTHDITVRSHLLVADEPKDKGGNDEGPTPWEYLLAAISSCCAITLQMWAEKYELDLGHVSVDATRKKGNEVSIEVSIENWLDAELQARADSVVGNCPVVQAVSGGLTITKTVFSQRAPVA